MQQKKGRTYVDRLQVWISPAMKGQMLAASKTKKVSWSKFIRKAVGEKLIELETQDNHR